MSPVYQPCVIYWSTMDDCVFCKIIAGKLPSSTLYENEDIIAFLDIGPVSRGHTLVAPKKHYKTPLETPDDVLANMLKAVKHITPAISNALGAEGFNITFNNGSVAGQVVPHTHLHIIPRYIGDKLHLWSASPYKEGEQEIIAKKIQSELN